MSDAPIRPRKLWLAPLGLCALTVVLSAAYGELVRARSLPFLSDRLLESLMGSPGSEDARKPGIPSAEEQSQTLPYAWPAQGELSSHFGLRWGRLHKGIDIVNVVGTPIVAAADGTVAYAGWSDGGYGYVIEILHRDGVRTLYAHNSKLMVAAGDLVKRSQVIALMGNSGRSTGPHLHFEIQLPGAQVVNPVNYLGKPT